MNRFADNTVWLYDRRNLTSNGVGTPIYKFEGHKAVVLCVQWSPDKSSVFGSSAEDGLLNIWDYDRVCKKSDRAAKSPAGSSSSMLVTGTKLLTSTGMRQTLGLLSVCLMTVRLPMEVEPITECSVNFSKIMLTETLFRPREKLLDKQRLLQSIHRHTYLKGPTDKLFSSFMQLWKTCVDGLHGT